MTKKTATKKTKQTTVSEKEIVDVNCIINKSDKAVYINWNNETYVGSRNLLQQLADGTLTKQDGTKAKAIPLSLKTDDGLQNLDKVFLTVKGKAVYFVPDEKTFLITSLDDIVKLLNDEFHYVKMGMFK